MPKNIVQDVIPPDRKSIRNIPLPHGRRGKVEPTSPRHIEREPLQGSEPEDRSFKFRLDASKWALWAIGVFSAVAFVVAFGELFSGATVETIPRREQVVIDGDFLAKPDGDTGALSYTPFSLEREKSVLVEPDSERHVEIPATGKIIVYNNYSTTPQRLIKNTRFETPDGLIYRIHDSITIPGRRSSGGEMLPGSVEVTVFADAAGEEYNIALTDFTIPGFKSNVERFKGFYARSKTPMTGGKVGLVKTVSDEKMLQVRARLEEEFRNELISEATMAVPTDSIFYKDAYRVGFDVISPIQDRSGDLKISVRAKFTAFFISQNGLSNAIAKQVLSMYDGAPVIVPNAGELLFELKKRTAVSAAYVGPIEFNLKGTATLVWQFDKRKLTSELSGRKKSELVAVVSAYPAIIRATAIVRPFWKNAFPKSFDKIKIITPDAN